MKNNKIFKVCTLGLITLALFTGCQKNGGNVSKMKKNDKISYSSDVNIIKDYYNIELYQFKDSKSLLKEYKEQIEYQKNTSEKVNVITDTENIYEATTFITPGEKAPAATEDNYGYLLFIKNDTDYVVVYSSSTAKDKSEMIDIGKKIKAKFEGEKDFKKVFDEYAKENNLNVTDNVFDKDGLKSIGCTYAINGSNSYTVTYSGTTGKVTKIKKEVFDLSDGEEKLFIIGLTSDDKTIWTLDFGTEEKGNKGDWVYAKTTDKTLYLGYNGIIESRDLQTGKKNWTSEMQVGWTIDNLIETEKTIFVFTGEGKETITLVNTKNGKPIYDYINVSKYLKSEKIADDYYDIDPASAKLDGDILTVKVTDDGNPYSVYDDNKEYKVELIGYLKINVNDYSIKFEKVK